jgi:hypothetical protein
LFAQFSTYYDERFIILFKKLYIKKIIINSGKRKISFSKYCFVDEYERLYQEEKRKKFFCGFYSFLS